MRASPALTAACVSVCWNLVYISHRQTRGENLHAFIYFSFVNSGLKVCKLVRECVNARARKYASLHTRFPTLMETHLEAVFRLRQSVTPEYCAHWCGQMLRSSRTGNLKLHKLELTFMTPIIASKKLKLSDGGIFFTKVVQKNLQLFYYICVKMHIVY